MTGEKKSSDLSSRLGVKRAGKLATKASKSGSNTSISSPPKVAIASAKAKKDEVHRRNNPFNAMTSQKHRKESDTTKDTISTTESQEEKQAATTTTGNGENTQDTRVLERLSELEKSQEIANEQQNTLKEELEKVRQHAQVYRETIEDYRRQLAETYTQERGPPGAFNDGSHSALPVSTPELMEYEFENERRKSFRLNEDLIKRNFELQSKIAELEARNYRNDIMSRENSDQGISRTQEEWDHLTARVHRSEKESRERLEQLLSLKSSISSLTRTESQVTDSELSEMFAQLANRVREWVISNFRRTKLNLSNVPTDTVEVLEFIFPDYQAIAPTDRLAMYQALVSNTLMHIFQEPIIIGLPETGPFAQIKQLAACIQDIGSDYQEWRRTTIRVLKRSTGKDEFEQEKERVLHRLAANLCHQLSILTSVTLSSSANSALIGIFNAATDIQDTLSLQKAQYNVQFFRTQEGKVVDFDDARMESINDLDDIMDEDGVVFTDRKFAFCVFPCLEKFGNEWGENADMRNVLFKARVCCGVG